ncbi:hypothetical protein ANCDUO_09752 [Ancylostoma duodenale]|uniref:Uncharacterized protein n=1 Tax=Ancylostoma duodenale TaxID=51022 RepID=A0A0C2GSG9_9BILA|nr:hypothetical protein ANCDUO_09752 [Ancylostoma duodenale]
MKNKKEQDFKRWKQIIAEIRQEGKRIRKKQKAEDSLNKRLGIFRNELRRHRSVHNAVKVIGGYT